MKTCDVAIIGSGIMGASAAYELARRGASVDLIDQAALPNPQGASVDYSKIFRFAYPDPLYVRMAVESLAFWRELEQQSATALLVEAGLLMLANREGGFETQTYEALRSQGLAAELLDGAEVAARFPQFHNAANAFAVFDPSGGILYADKAVQATLNLARRFGAEVFENERVVALEQNERGTLIRSHTGQSWHSPLLLIASGPWTRKLLPDFAGLLTTTRQEVVYFEPPKASGKPFDNGKANFAIGELPIFIEMDSGFYGFPAHHNGALKIGNHLKGQTLDPYAFDEQVGEEFIEGCREFFTRSIPALAEARVAQSHVCIYNNSPDDDFIIDWHPQMGGVLLATGFSGHGYKFGPLIGRIVAELLLEGKSRYPLDRFRLSRFQK
jgi:monomeric sarcosine oxidase